MISPVNAVLLVFFFLSYLFDKVNLALKRITLTNSSYKCVLPGGIDKNLDQILRVVGPFLQTLELHARPEVHRHIGHGRLERFRLCFEFFPADFTCRRRN